MTYRTITVEKRGAADWLTLNRPDQLNSISLEMVDELSHYFGALFNDRETRVVVMRGEGRAFCAGLDIKDRQNANRPDPFGGGFGFQGHLADVYVKMLRDGVSAALASDMLLAAMESHAGRLGPGETMNEAAITAYAVRVADVLIGGISA